jgi:hypothetical protein
MEEVLPILVLPRMPVLVDVRAIVGEGDDRHGVVGRRRAGRLIALAFPDDPAG